MFFIKSRLNRQTFIYFKNRLSSQEVLCMAKRGFFGKLLCSVGILQGGKKYGYDEHRSTIIDLEKKMPALHPRNVKKWVAESQKSMVTEDWSKCTVIPLRIFPLEKRIITLRWHNISINTERVDNKKIIVECYVPDTKYQHLPYECKQPPLEW
jgi:hypothetical protein